jgi:hypothetical protein
MTLRPSLKPIFRSSIDSIKLDEGADLEEVIIRFNELASLTDFLFKSLSFDSNFNGYITTVTIPATSNIQVQHFLGVRPKYRIILNQTGNGVITDIPLEWTDKVISIRNNGSVEVVVTLLIARE